MCNSNSLEKATSHIKHILKNFIKRCGQLKIKTTRPKQPNAPKSHTLLQPNKNTSMKKT
jgi:hypothetical protein